MLRFFRQDAFVQDRRVPFAERLREFCNLSEEDIAKLAGADR